MKTSVKSNYSPLIMGRGKGVGLLFHYLKISLRNMRRFKLQTIVCLTGLAVGMTCFALGTLWLRYIESFEDFVPNVENIYLLTNMKNQFSGHYSYYTCYNDGEQVKEQRPEVKDYCVTSDCWATVQVPGREKMSMEMMEADSGYVRMFGLKAVEGTLEHFGIGDIALTQSAARKLFGDESAMGRQVEVNNYVNSEPSQCTVVAIIPDRPSNTQFRYEALVSLPTNEEWKEFDMDTFHTFVELHANAPRDSVCNPIVLRNVYRSRAALAPLTKLRSDYPSAFVLINTQYVRWFMAIGLLVIACSLFNYLITMVSHMRRRGWEMSLRRVLGSSRVHIIYMVSLETLLTFLLASLLGSLLTWLALPYFRKYSGIELPLGEVAARLSAYLGIVVAIGLALSALTAWIVMRRTQHNILASRQLKHSSNILDRVGVLLQMALSMGIIFVLVVMLRQVNFLKNTDELGFRHQDIGYLTRPTEEVRKAVHQSPLVVEAMDDIRLVYPKTVITYQYFYSDPACTQEVGRYESFALNSETCRFLGLQLIAGRLPQPTAKSAPREICVNETFCHSLNLAPANAIGKRYYFNGAAYEICGVLRDTLNLGPTIPPIATVYPYLEPGPTDTSEYEEKIVFITQPGRMDEVLKSLEGLMEGDMLLQSIEESYDRYIQSEHMLISILFSVGGASLFVCIIGTFSLVSLSLQQRRKEIAIRKVHGARTKDILSLFLKGQVVSLLIAAIVAFPIAYIIMRHWLEGYQKQVAIDWWLIPATFAAIAAVVLATIALKVWQAAKESTVEALK